MIVFTVSAMIKLLLIPFNKFLISDFFFISRNSIWFFKYLSSLPIFMFSFNFFNRFMADWIFQSAHPNWLAGWFFGKQRGSHFLSRDLVS